MSAASGFNAALVNLKAFERILRAAADLLANAQPAPFFGSSCILPRDHALRFSLDGREYVGAHPDFWRQTPAAEACVSPFQLGAIEIRNMDLDNRAMEEFSQALVRSWGKRS